MLNYLNTLLHIEEVAITDIAAAVGTPCYCYSAAAITDNYQQFIDAKQALPDLTICFAVKSNSNLAVLKHIASLGGGADCVSEGEIRRALLAGVNPNKIVFSGVGKTQQEMTFALQNNILQFNIESNQELQLLNKVAELLGIHARIGIRVNPDIDAGTHYKITTGTKDNKFGISWADARQTYELARTLPMIKVSGISIHIGSQITSLEPFARAFDKVIELYHELQASGHKIETIDLGGGLGINYDDDTRVPRVSDYMSLIEEKFAALQTSIIIEPGRALVGNAGILVTKLLFQKISGDKIFWIVDTGMNDFARPSLYDAKHEILPVIQANNHNFSTVDIVGPICESSDVFARQAQINHLNNGELLIFKDTGAYGSSMSSVYNSRPLIPEVLIKGQNFYVVRKRQTFEEMLALETTS